MKKDALLFINNKKIGTIDFLDNTKNGYSISVLRKSKIDTYFLLNKSDEEINQHFEPKFNAFLDKGKSSFLIKLTTNEKITFDGIITKVIFQLDTKMKQQTNLHMNL